MRLVDRILRPMFPGDYHGSNNDIIEFTRP